MTARRVLVSLLVLASLAACRSAPDAASGPAVPEGVRVRVEVDGHEDAPITSEGLRAAAPTYHDADHRAWRLTAVLPAGVVKAGMQLEVEERSGRRTLFARLGEETGGEPVLMVNRKGQVLIALVEPDNPFPAFHGRGGNRGQSARANRIRGVTTLRLISQ